MRTAHKRALLGLVLLIIGVLLALYWRQLLALVQDLPRLRSWLRGLGPWGPLALIGLNALQILVAPVPGQLVQAVAGYLFGLWPGALYGGLGMALGGTLSMTVGRLYGRPVVTRIIGEERLIRWERAAHADSPVVWAILMLPPFGDIPYLIAGLTKAPIGRVLIITIIVRGPSVILYAAVGAGAVSGPAWLLGVVILGLALLGLAGIIFGPRLQPWFEGVVLSRFGSDGDVDESGATDGSVEK